MNARNQSPASPIHPGKKEARHDAAGYVIRDSKSQKKRDAKQLQTLSEALVEAKAFALSNLTLPDDIRAAIDEAQNIQAHGGRKRQLHYLAKLMRSWQEAAPEAVAALMQWHNNAHQQQHQEAKITSATLRWVQNMLQEAQFLAAGGYSETLDRFAERYPLAPIATIKGYLVEAHSQTGHGKKTRRHLQEAIKTVLNQSG